MEPGWLAVPIQELVARDAQPARHRGGGLDRPRSHHVAEPEPAPFVAVTRTRTVPPWSAFSERVRALRGVGDRDAGAAHGVAVLPLVPVGHRRRPRPGARQRRERLAHLRRSGDGGRRRARRSRTGTRRRGCRRGRPRGMVVGGVVRVHPQRVGGAACEPGVDLARRGRRPDAGVAEPRPVSSHADAIRRRCPGKRQARCRHASREVCRRRRRFPVPAGRARAGVEGQNQDKRKRNGGHAAAEGCNTHSTPRVVVTRSDPSGGARDPTRAPDLSVSRSAAG
jgi:hypothetical protein